MLVRAVLQNISRCSHHFCFCFKQARRSTANCTDSCAVQIHTAPWRSYLCTRQICELSVQTTFQNTFYVSHHTSCRSVTPVIKYLQVTTHFVTVPWCNVKRCDPLSGVSGSKTGREIQSCSPAQHSHLSCLYREVPGPSFLQGTNNPDWGHLVIVLSDSKKIPWKHLNWSRNGSLQILWIHYLLIILQHHSMLTRLKRWQQCKIIMW